MWRHGAIWQRLIVVLALCGGGAVAHPGSAPAGIVGRGVSGLQVYDLDPSQPATAPPTATPLPTATSRPDVPSLFYVPGSSGILLVNPGTEASSAGLALSNHAGGDPQQRDLAKVPPGGLAVYYLPSEVWLPIGAYAAVIQTGQPVVVLADMEWSATGDRVTFPPSEPAMTVLVPRWSKGLDGNTALSIQNTDQELPSDLRVQMMADGRTDPTRFFSLLLGPGAATTLLPDIHPDLAALPEDWSGWVQVTGTRPVAVLATTERAGAPGAIALAGVPATAAASMYFFPFATNHYALEAGNPGAGTVSTVIRVRNPGPDPIQALLTYRGTDAPRNAAACQPGATIVHDDGPVTIAPGAEAQFHQLGEPQPGTGASDLPDGCVVTATVVLSGPAIASVDIVDGLGMGWAAYSPPARFGRRLDLPWVRREHRRWRLTTPVQVMNVSDQPATVSVRVRLSDGTDPCEDACQFTIPPLGGHLWLPTEIGAFPGDRVGSAVIESDQPIGAVVVDVAFDGGIDPSAYLGFVEGARASHLPLLLRTQRLADLPPEPPTATPTPSAAPTATPTPTPHVTPTPTSTSGPVLAQRVWLPWAWRRRR